MRKYLIVAASLAAVALVGPATAGAKGDSLAAARSATAKYHRLQTATHHGYGKLVDAQGIACIDNPGVGGMGIHYANDALVGDATRVSCAAAAARASRSKADGRRKTHKYKSTISSATLSTANGYPGIGGTAVWAGAMRLTGFGEGALVDRLKITGQPEPNVFSFAGTEVDYLAAGSWRSTYTGTDTIQPDGSQEVTVNGRFKGGTGTYRGAKGTYHFSGTVPSGSTVLTGHSTGSITY